MEGAMTILMIRPVRFGYNEQTAENNAFQHQPAESQEEIQRRAVKEFDGLVEKLRAHGIDVMVVQDSPEPHTPDSIFPNNWVSFHHDGTIVLYPMFAENRRLERKEAVLSAVKNRFHVKREFDFAVYESEGRFLEGTGSFVLDRENRIAYACRSPRTDESLFRNFCSRLGYRPVMFDATDKNGTAIYHTNVMMCVADRYVVINLDAVAAADRSSVTAVLKKSGKVLVTISHEQMAAFAGNMLQVERREGGRYLVMSSQAFESLDTAQRTVLESFNPIIHVPLDTIETNGGGSARCMMAEVYLPENKEGDN